MLKIWSEKIMFKRWRRITGGTGDFVITGGGAGDSVTTRGGAGCAIPFAVLIVIYDELRRNMVRWFPDGWFDRETYYWRATHFFLLEEIEETNVT